jgi:hypothetical protein
VADLERRGDSRDVAVHRMMERYVDGMEANVPVHEWP